MTEEKLARCHCQALTLRVFDTKLSKALILRGFSEKLDKY